MKKIIIFILCIFSLLLTSCIITDCTQINYTNDKVCYLADNTALGVVSHRVSCEKEFTYYQINKIPTDNQCMTKYGERVY